MFEILWERAAPMAVASTGSWQMDRPGTRLPPEADQLLPLLAAGLNDKAIAHELGISASTLARRITDLMDRLDAQTRFQLGWMAARYGSAPERDDANA
jgi:DNA-binding NarL/FixJ family response regulator